MGVPPIIIDFPIKTIYFGVSLGMSILTASRVFLAGSKSSVATVDQRTFSRYGEPTGETWNFTSQPRHQRDVTRMVDFPPATGGLVTKSDKASMMGPPFLKFLAVRQKQSKTALSQSEWHAWQYLPLGGYMGLYLCIVCTNVRMFYKSTTNSTPCDVRLSVGWSLASPQVPVQAIYPLGFCWGPAFIAPRFWLSHLSSFRSERIYLLALLGNAMGNFIPTHQASRFRKRGGDLKKLTTGSL